MILSQLSSLEYSFLFANIHNILFKRWAGAGKIIRQIIIHKLGINRMMNIKLTLEPNNHGKYIYHPGQVLKGTVTLILLRNKNLKGIDIKVYGRARTYWTKQIVGRYVDTHVYESLEVLIDSSIYLVGPKEGPTFELQAGTHKYNFSYQLPDNLPSSVSFQYGNIAYFIEAVPTINHMYGQQTKVPFGVTRCDDLNWYRSLREPVEKKKSYSFGTQNDSKPLNLTVKLPQSGFVANQTVSMSVLYENSTDNKVSRTTVTFYQKVEFRSSTIPQLKIEDYKLVEVHADGVDANQSKSVPISFKLPNVASSNRKYCNIITISYYIEIVGDLGGKFTNLKVKIPVTIGDIPIRTDQINSAIEPSAPPLEPLSGLVNDLLSALPSAPASEILMDDLPPSYEEAMKMITN